MFKRAESNKTTTQALAGNDTLSSHAPNKPKERRAKQASADDQPVLEEVSQDDKTLKEKYQQLQAVLRAKDEAINTLSQTLKEKDESLLLSEKAVAAKEAENKKLSTELEEEKEKNKSLETQLRIKSDNNETLAANLADKDAENLKLKLSDNRKTQVIQQQNAEIAQLKRELNEVIAPRPNGLPEREEETFHHFSSPPVPPPAQWNNRGLIEQEVKAKSLPTASQGAVLLALAGTAALAETFFQTQTVDETLNISVSLLGQWLLAASLSLAQGAMEYQESKALFSEVRLQRLWQQLREGRYVSSDLGPSALEALSDIVFRNGTLAAIPPALAEAVIFYQALNQAVPSQAGAVTAATLGATAAGLQYIFVEASNLNRLWNKSFFERDQQFLEMHSEWQDKVRVLGVNFLNLLSVLVYLIPVFTESNELLDDLFSEQHKHDGEHARAPAFLGAAFLAAAYAGGQLSLFGDDLKRVAYDIPTLRQTLSAHWEAAPGRMALTSAYLLLTTAVYANVAYYFLGEGLKEMGGLSNLSLGLRILLGSLSALTSFQVGITRGLRCFPMVTDQPEWGNDASERHSLLSSHAPSGSSTSTAVTTSVFYAGLLYAVIVMSCKIGFEECDPHKSEAELVYSYLPGTSVTAALIFLKAAEERRTIRYSSSTHLAFAGLLLLTAGAGIATQTIYRAAASGADSETLQFRSECAGALVHGLTSTGAIFAALDKRERVRRSLQTQATSEPVNTDLSAESGGRGRSTSFLSCAELSSSFRRSQGAAGPFDSSANPLLNRHSEPAGGRSGVPLPRTSM